MIYKNTAEKLSRCLQFNISKTLKRDNYAFELEVIFKGKLKQSIRTHIK